MSPDRKGQAVQVVTAFEQADQPSPCKTFSAIQEMGSRPVEILLRQIDLGERIAMMR